MIENALISATRHKEFIADSPEFRLDFPAASPLLPRTTVTFRQQGEHGPWFWKDREITSSIDSAEREFAESLLLRCRRDLARFPSSARARINLGTGYLGQGRLEEAAEQFSEALRLDRANCVAVGGLARVRLLQGQLDEARQLYRLQWQTNPLDISPLLGLANIAVREGALVEAIAILREAIANNDDKPIARFYLAILLLRLNREHEAIGCLRAATRDQVRWPALHEALGMAHVFSGNLRKAEKAFRTALHLFPDGTRPARGLAEVLFRLGETDAAEKVLGDALSKHPNDLTAREILARVYERDEEYKRARAQLLEAEPLVTHADQRSRIQNNIGVCTSLLDQTRGAANWFARSIESAPVANPIPYLNAARLAIEIKDFDAASRALNVCRLQFPAAAAQVVTLLAVCLSQQGKDTEAARELTQLISTGNGSALAYAVLGGIVADEFRTPERAIAVLEDGNRRFPDDLIIRNNLAYAYLQAGLPERARIILESIQRNAKPDHTDVALIATWGLLRLWEGSAEEGEEAYRKAEELARQQGGMLAERVRQKMHLETRAVLQTAGRRRQSVCRSKTGAESCWSKVVSGGFREPGD